MKKLTAIPVFMLIILMNVSLVNADVIYVDGQKATDGDGLSWATAKNNLWTVLENLYASYGTAPGRTSVKVKQGTYYPSTSNADPRKASFRIQINLDVIGGYSGVGETRNPRVYKTILSGDIGVKSNISDNSYHVVEAGRDVGPGFPSIDGFTISGGNANGTGNDKSGGGVICWGDVNIDSCEIMNNRADDLGGGIFLVGSFNGFVGDGSIRFSNIHDNFAANGGGGYAEAKNGRNYGLTLNWDTLTNNSTNGYGGAVALFGSQYSSSTADHLRNMTDLTGCLFASNNAKENGAAIYAIAGGLSINGSKFTNNGTNSTYPVKNGGAVYFEGAGLTVTGSTFTGNKASTGNGGAIYAISGNSYFWDLNRQYFEPLIQVKKSTFESNSANLNGGAMYCIADSLVPNQDNTHHEYKTIVDSCTFKINSTIAAGGLGGALLINGYSDIRNSNFMSNSSTTGGAVSEIYFNVGDVIKFHTSTVTVNTAFYNRELTQIDTSQIWNSRFIQNTATDGTALYNWKGMVVNSLFARNSGGRTFYNANSFANTAKLINCTFTENTATSGNAGVYNVQGLIGNNIFWKNTGDELTSCSAPSYCIIEGGSTTNNNKNTDPQLFYSSTNEDYFLSMGSPAVDAAYRNHFPVYFIYACYDIVGTQREPIDIGAYEAGSTCLIDFTVTPLSNGKIIGGQKTSFKASGSCEPNITLYQWNFGNGTTATEKNPVITYTSHGDFDVKLTVYYKNGTVQTVTKRFTVECGPPGDPAADYLLDPAYGFIKGSTDNSGTIIWEVEDKCPLGSETVTFRDASVPYKCSSVATINAWEWKLDNVVKSTTGNTSVTLSTATPNVLSLKVTDINGKTNTITRKIQLVPCTPGFNSVDFSIANNGNIIQGELFLDIINQRGYPGNGIKTFQLQENVSYRCECLITSKELTWKIRYLNTNYNYPVQTGAGPKSFTSDLGFGTYEITLDVLINGSIRQSVTKKLMVAFPIPFVACPPYGCNAVSTICNTLFDTIDGGPIDKSVYLTNGSGSLSFRAIGSGFARKPATMPDNSVQYCGYWDEGAMRSVPAFGDFTITARVTNFTSLPAGVQAGLMVRPSYTSYDKMLFVGTKGGKDLILHRNKVRTDAYSYPSTTSSNTWFRISRTNGVITTFGSTDGTTWTSLDPANHPLTGLEGSVVIGLAAAGKPSIPYTSVSFDKITITVPNVNLTFPNDIISTVFSDGNYVSNWGFENLRNIFTGKGTGVSFNHRYTSTSSQVAYEGHYCGRATSKTTSWYIESEKYPFNPVRDGQNIGMLSVDFYVKPATTAVQNAPSIAWYDANNNLLSTSTLESRTYTADVWNHMQYYVMVPSNNNIASFSFIPFESNLAIATIDIDNILICPMTGIERNLPLTTITYANGLNQVFQSVQNVGDSDIVSANLMDVYGRAERSLPVFSSKSSLHNVKKDPVAEMESYLKPVNVGWDVVTLQKDHGTILYENSALGKEVQILGRKNYLDIKNVYSNDATTQNPVPHQTITETQAGFDYYQNKYQTKRVYNDAYGHIIKDENSYNDGTSNPKLITSSREPDILDRNWKVTSPLGQNCSQTSSTCKPPVTYRYSTTNDVLETNDPDAGITLSLYDKLNRQRFFKDANKSLNKQFLVTMYDVFSRMKSVYLVTDNDGSKWNQANADDPLWPGSVSGFEQWAQLLIKNEYDYEPEGLPSGITDLDFVNAKGQITARTAYTSKGTIYEYYGYSSKGLLKKKWKKILDLPLQTITIDNNSAGQIISKTITGTEPSNNRNFERKEIYSYNYLNKLSKIVRLNGSALDQLVSYDYRPDGRLIYEYLGNSNLLRNSYKYDFADRMNKRVVEKSTNGVWSDINVYRQNLTYDLRGNLRRQNYYLGGLTEPVRAFFYDYDQFNRMILGSDYASNGTPSHTDNQIAAAVEYDDEGSITRFAQGPQVVNFPTTGGQYYYYPNSHRLEKITGLIFENGKDRSATGNYQYDANGNLILDKANKRKITYDYRNLPASVVEYSDAAMTAVKNFTEYYYDANGSRVLKIQSK
jgi:PKD domain